MEDFSQIFSYKNSDASPNKNNAILMGFDSIEINLVLYTITAASESNKGFVYWNIFTVFFIL